VRAIDVRRGRLAAVAGALILRIPLPFGLLALALAGVACGSSQPDSKGLATEPVLAVDVAPKNPEVTPGDKVTFTATLSNEPNAAVSWSLVPAEPDSGTIDAEGVYTASQQTGTFTVVATSTADPSLTGSTTVHVVPPMALDPSGLLPSDRATTWKPGVTYNGGIPPRLTLCATLSPLGGSNDDTAQIQSAIDACPAGQTVKLKPGTFNIGAGIQITKSNVTLRGSGPGVTTLTSTGGSAQNSVILAGTLWYRWIDGRPLTADAVKDATSVTVSDPSGLAAGELVVVDETYDPSLTVYAHPAQLQNGEYLGWGECKCYHPDGSYRTDSGTNCPVLSDWTPQKAMNQSRPIGQAMEIASVDGSTVTFTTPFHSTYRVSQSAHIARFGQNDNVTSTKVVTGVGVEELTVDRATGGDFNAPVSFNVAAHSWARHIEVAHSTAVNVLFSSAFQCELRDSYIHETTNPNEGGAGYGIGVDSYSADNLVENTISWAFNKVMVMRDSGGGNVIGYNYMQDSYGQGYPTLPEVGLNAAHMATSHHELFEGNESHNFGSDATWGNTIYVTALRNHLTGLRIAHPGVLAQLVDQSGRHAIDIADGDEYFSFLGNVLGCSARNTCAGMGDSACSCASLDVTMPGGDTGQTSWQYDPTQDSNTDARMWQLMHAGAAAQATLLRQGNFDWVTQSQKWPGVGGTGTPDRTPSPLPTMPASLYLRAKPAFMGQNPWPWVDPSTGTTYVLPARARFDAGTPNTLR
jgi:hypothetical protein